MKKPLVDKKPFNYLCSGNKYLRAIDVMFLPAISKLDDAERELAATTKVVKNKEIHF